MPVVRSAADLIDEIDRALQADAARRRSRDAALPQAERMAPKLPWTHRAGRPGKGDWRDIFRSQLLRADKVETPYEQVAGHQRAAYFFVGSCAYPSGAVALLFTFTGAPPAGATFNPYDTGSLRSVSKPRDPAAPWDETARSAHFASTLGSATELPRFLGPYIAAHFRDPLDYVRRGQTEQPDFDTYHGLTGGDRRGWTIEARAPDDVPVRPTGSHLQEIWLSEDDMLDELPDDFRLYARVRPGTTPLETSVAESIERAITGKTP